MLTIISSFGMLLDTNNCQALESQAREYYFCMIVVNGGVYIAQCLENGSAITFWNYLYQIQYLWGPEELKINLFRQNIGLCIIMEQKPL